MDMDAEKRTSPIRVMIIDDDDDIREGIRWMVEHSEGFECVGSFRSCTPGLEAIEENPPDVILMDIGMPGQSGIECVGIMKERFPEVQILMLTVYSDDERIFQSLRAGAVGYLLKKMPADKLLTAIRETREGGVPFSGEVARKVLQYFQQPRGGTVFSSLSPREVEVLNALIDGHSYKIIAEKLFLSVHTVRFHLHNIYQKLHVSSRSEAVAKALREKIG
jgi:DNA-binding NarL/FixJ family response regulator